MKSRPIEDQTVTQNRSRRLTKFALFALGILPTLFAGCKKSGPDIAPPKPPEVTYDYPVLQEVRDYEDFTGRTEAIESVEIRSRVTGELTKVHFADLGKEGIDVVKGEPLFDIDSRQYVAELKRAEATLAQTEGVLNQKEQALKRAKDLRAKGTNTIEDLETAQADEVVAKANRDLAIANKELAKLNVEYCKIVAPISGRISRKMIDVGNQVIANTTPLTTIRTLQPMHANFDVDERTILKLRRLLQQGELTSARGREGIVDVGLADDEKDTFPLSGVINFVENTLDSGTGTLRVRILIQNLTKSEIAELIGPAFNAMKAVPEQITGTHIALPLSDLRLLAPNMFVRVRFWIGQKKPAILVPEAALVSDQGIRHLFVLKQAYSLTEHDLPAKIVEEFKKKYGDVKILAAEKRTTGDRNKAKFNFEIIFEKGAEKLEAVFDADGKFITEEKVKYKVEDRRVEIGLQQGNMRVIKSGVTTNDKVIVDGLQRVRANILVTATEQKKTDSKKGEKEMASAK